VLQIKHSYEDWKGPLRRPSSWALQTENLPATVHNPKRSWR